MKLESTGIKIQYDDYNNAYFCDRVKIVNEHVFDTITDIDVIVEVREVNGETETTLHGLRCFNVNQEMIDEKDYDAKKIRTLIYNAIYFLP